MTVTEAPPRASSSAADRPAIPAPTIRLSASGLDVSSVAVGWAAEVMSKTKTDVPNATMLTRSPVHNLCRTEIARRYVSGDLRDTLS